MSAAPSCLYGRQTPRLEYDLRWLVEDGRIVGLRFLGRDSVPFVGRYRTDP